MLASVGNCSCRFKKKSVAVSIEVVKNKKFNTLNTKVNDLEKTLCYIYFNSDISIQHR